MFEIHKQYVFDENGNAIAVQISIDEFEKMEEILAGSEQILFSLEQSNVDAFKLNSPNYRAFPRYFSKYGENTS